MKDLMPSKALIHYFAFACTFTAISLPAAELPQKIISPFIEEHCVRCHGPKKQKGDVRLDTLSLNIDSDITAQRWQDVLDMLNAAEMPPEDEDQPTTAELTEALHHMTDTLKMARLELADQGRAITMRRLNRREYINTIDTLFGFKVNPDSIPEDNPTDSYDTIGSQQFFSAYHFDHYHNLAREIITAAIKWGQEERVDPTIEIEEVEDKTRGVAKSYQKKLDQLKAAKKGLKEGKSARELGFKDKKDLEKFFNKMDDGGDYDALAQYLKRPLVDSGLYLDGEAVKFTRIDLSNIDPRTGYKIRFVAGINGEQPPLRKFLLLETEEEGMIGQLKINGTTDNPSTEEFFYVPYLNADKRRIEARENTMQRFERYLKNMGLKNVDRASIWIDRVEVEGPYYKPVSFFEKTLFPDAPLRGRRAFEEFDGKAKQFIEYFAYEAFRRLKPDALYIDKLHKLYTDARSAGDTPYEALIEPLSIILTSPGFLYIAEASNSEPATTPLTARELAVRLSYFLWSAPPDEELYRAAADGSLLDSGVLAAQTDRMIQDKKSWALAEGFTSHWLDLERYDNIVINADTYYQFNEAVRASARKEPLALFQTLLRENLPITSLINSDFTMLDEVLANHYDIPGVDGSNFRKVTLPPEKQRGGLLGTTAFLTMGSTGDRTSPIIRGALVMEILLDDKPADPPPNVPELTEVSDKPITVRDAILMHQEQPQCASCHADFDPIGFGLENFDAIGLWREEEQLDKKTFVPIKTDGTIEGQSSFKNLAELKARLMERKDDLTRSLVKGIMAYGLGRNVEFSDGNTVDTLVQGMRKYDYNARMLIHLLVQHELFSKK